MHSDWQLLAVLAPARRLDSAADAFTTLTYAHDG